MPPAGPGEPRAEVQPRQALVHRSTCYYVKDVFTLDLGPSLVLRNRTVNDIIKEHFPRSVKLGMLAFVWASSSVSRLGIVSAPWPNTVFDYVVHVLLERRLRPPSFFVGDAAHLLLCGAEQLLSRPTGGRSSFWDLSTSASSCRRSRSGSSPMAYFARLVRGTMLETMQQDYVRTAKAKGLRWRRVVVRHVLRNSLIPVVTAVGPLIGLVITGTFVIEIIFSIPGIGRYFVDAVEAATSRSSWASPCCLGRRHPRQPRRGHPLRVPRPADPRGTFVDVAISGPPGRRSRLARRRRPRPLRPQARRSSRRACGATPRRRYLRNKGAVAAAIVFIVILLYCS